MAKQHQSKPVNRNTYTIIAAGGPDLWAKCKEASGGVAVQIKTSEFDCPLGYLMEDYGDSLKVATLACTRRSPRPRCEVIVVPKKNLTEYLVRS